MSSDLDLSFYRERGRLFIPDSSLMFDQDGDPRTDWGKYTRIAYQHIAELYPYVVYAKPAQSELPAGAVLGFIQYSVPGKVRFIWKRSKEIVPGVLPQDLARAWVRDLYKLPIRRRKSQLAHGADVPLHSREGLWGRCHYVDIRRAYLHFLKFGFDVEYRRGEYLGAEPVSIPDEIRASKFCYATAVTMSRNARSTLDVMGHQGPTERHPLNMFSNPCLYALAHDTLNAIAGEMLAVLGDACVYINTDGYIIRDGYEFFALKIIESWGLTARIKFSGDCEVRGVGSWRVGAEQTKRFSDRGGDFTNDLLDKPDRQWLKRELMAWRSQLED